MRSKHMMPVPADSTVLIVAGNAALAGEPVLEPIEPVAAVEVRAISGGSWTGTCTDRSLGHSISGNDDVGLEFRGEARSVDGSDPASILGIDAPRVGAVNHIVTPVMETGFEVSPGTLVNGAGIACDDFEYSEVGVNVGVPDEAHA